MDLYGPKVAGRGFKMAFHHLGVRFDDDLEGYEAALAAMKAKDFEIAVESGIEGISRLPISIRRPSSDIISSSSISTRPVSPSWTGSGMATSD